MYYSPKELRELLKESEWFKAKKKRSGNNEWKAADYLQSCSYCTLYSIGYCFFSKNLLIGENVKIKIIEIREAEVEVPDVKTYDEAERMAVKSIKAGDVALQLVGYTSLIR